MKKIISPYSQIKRAIDEYGKKLTPSERELLIEMLEELRG